MLDPSYSLISCFQKKKPQNYPLKPTIIFVYYDVQFMPKSPIFTQFKDNNATQRKNID